MLSYARYIKMIIRKEINLNDYFLKVPCVRLTSDVTVIEKTERNNEVRVCNAF